MHTAQLMPLPLTVSCFSKIQIGFTFLVPAHLGSPKKGPLNVSLSLSDLTANTTVQSSPKVTIERYYYYYYDTRLTACFPGQPG